MKTLTILTFIFIGFATSFNGWTTGQFRAMMKPIIVCDSMKDRAFIDEPKIYGSNNDNDNDRDNSTSVKTNRNGPLPPLPYFELLAKRNLFV